MDAYQGNAAPLYACGCPWPLPSEGPHDGPGCHHWACCEEVSHTPGTGRVCDVVLDRCLHDRPEECPYLRPRWQHVI